MQVAQTILQQLGGAGRLSAMIGARNFVAYHDALSFTFAARGRDGIRAVRVILTPADLYTVEFIKVGRPTSAYIGRHVVETVEYVYADMLRATIEQRTGLALAL
jgi:hypothetical protein